MDLTEIQCKTCYKCGLTLNFSFFSRHKSKKDGLQTYCKSCCSKISTKHMDKVGGKRKLAEYERQIRADPLLREQLIQDAKQWDKDNAERVSEYKRKWVDNNYTKSRLASIKSRAKAEGIVFNLTLEDIQIPSICPILLIPLTRARSENYAHRSAISVDRLLPGLGYTKGNIHFISNKANTMKQDATPAELLLFADWVYRTFRNEELNTKSTETLEAIELSRS
jgi:hypothetical protein